ncbi:Putative ribonuclease H protein, partial [Glycine soja]
WGSHQEASKIPWVKWDTVCLPKNNGGLGIKDLSKFNEALLGKWGWELANNHNQPWTRILLSKYGGWKELISGGKSKFSSQWWQDLKTIFQQQHNNCFLNNLKWRVGCGSKISFWKDKWLGDNYNLQAKYPNLYLISKQQ